MLFGRKEYEGLCSREIGDPDACRAAVMVPFWHECHGCSSDQFHVQFLPTSWRLSMDLGLAWLLGLSVVHSSVLHPEELLVSLIALSQMP